MNLKQKKFQEFRILKNRCPSQNLRCRSKPIWIRTTGGLFLLNDNVSYVLYNIHNNLYINITH